MDLTLIVLTALVGLLVALLLPLLSPWKPQKPACQRWNATKAPALAGSSDPTDGDSAIPNPSPMAAYLASTHRWGAPVTETPGIPSRATKLLLEDDIKNQGNLYGLCLSLNMDEALLKEQLRVKYKLVAGCAACSTLADPGLPRALPFSARLHASVAARACARFSALLPPCC